MSEDKKRIDELEEKLITLHEKLDETKDEKIKVEKKVKKKDWFTPQMLAVYMAIVGGVGAWGENCVNRYHKHQEKQEEQQKEKNKDLKVGDSVIRYVDLRVNDVTDTCELYLDAVLEAMPNYQRNKVEKFLAENEVDELKEELSDTHERIAEIEDNIETHALELPTTKDKPFEPEPIRTSADIRHSPYQLILQAVEEDQKIDIKELTKNLRRKRSPDK